MALRDENTLISVQPLLGSYRAMTAREQVTQLHDELGDAVYRYLVMLGLTPENAEDLCQECFVRIFIALEGHERVERPRAWLIKVAHNLAMNQFRLDRREQRHTSPWIDPILESEKDRHPNPEEASLDRERHWRLHRAIAALSPQQRHCLYLRSEGLRYREIAETLGIRIGSVSEFLRRAIDHLRKSAL
jgi:RNA polymerase sigma-70 factor (ECF subfamily)